jgi:hypothetical protein
MRDFFILFYWLDISLPSMRLPSAAAIMRTFGRGQNTKLWWVAANQRQVLKAPPAQKGRRAHKDLLDQRVRPALQDLLDLLDQRVKSALLDLLDQKAKLVFRRRSTL